MDMNKRFAELAGVSCHVWETKGMDGKMYSHRQPNYAAEIREVLKVMRAREDWSLFAPTVGRWDGSTAEYFVRDDYILDTTGKLRDAAIEWMEAHKA